MCIFELAMYIVRERKKDQFCVAEVSGLLVVLQQVPSLSSEYCEAKNREDRGGGKDDDDARDKLQGYGNTLRQLEGQRRRDFQERVVAAAECLYFCSRHFD